MVWVWAIELEWPISSSIFTVDSIEIEHEKLLQVKKNYNMAEK